MSNANKFIDRSPQIVPAGLESNTKLKVEGCFKEDVSLQEKVEALKHEAGIWKDDKPKFINPVPPSDGKRFCGVYTDMRALLSPEWMSPYEMLQQELKETTYTSYWNQPLGKGRDMKPNLPNGMDPENTIFGMKTTSKVTAGELVSPPKLAGQVQFESEIGEEFYRKSHLYTKPGEQITRKYEGPNYSPYLTFGKATPSDDQGIWVRRVLNWIDNKDICPANNTQADYYKRSNFKMGKTLEPNHYVGTCVPEDHMFGNPSKRVLFGVAELMRDSKPCLLKRDQLDYLEHINSLRFFVKKRNPPFIFKDLFDYLKLCDKNDCGYVSLEDVYESCNQFNLNVDKNLLKEVMEATGILMCASVPNQCVNYSEFVKLINWKYDFPLLPKITDVPPQYQHYESTAQAANKDLLKPNNLEMNAAGIPSARNDRLYPVTERRCDIECLNDETDISTLLRPSIYTQYGVSHRDFFQVRNKEQIRKIFCGIGVTLPDDLFEELWTQACKQDQTGGVCVETFRNILDRLSTHHLLSQ